MSMTDPIADMLTRIRNACGSKHRRVDIPASKMKIEIARLLKANNFITDYKTVDGGRRPPAAARRAQVRAGRAAGDPRAPARVEPRPSQVRRRRGNSARAQRPRRRDPQHVEGADDRSRSACSSAPAANFSLSSGKETETMSRIGKIPIQIPKGVTVTSKAAMVKVKGPKGELDRTMHSDIGVAVDGDGGHRVAPVGRTDPQVAARTVAHARRQHGRGRDEGILEAARDHGRRLQGGSEAVRPAARARILAPDRVQGAEGNQAPRRRSRRRL